MLAEQIFEAEIVELPAGKVINDYIDLTWYEQKAAKLINDK